MTKISTIIKIFIFMMINIPICFGVDVFEGKQLPYGVSGHSAGIVGGKVVVVGGSYWSEDKTQKIFLKGTLVFEEGCWKQGPVIPLEVYCSMYDYDDSGLYIVGGRNYEKLSSYFFCLKSIDNQMVIRNLPDFPEGIADGSSVIYDSKMYVSCPANSKGLTNSMWSINLESEDKRWVQCQSLPGKPRSFPGLVKIGERIVLLGGIVLPKFEVLKDAYAYSPKEDKWERLANLPCPCYGFGARAIDNKKILIAGIGDEKIRNSIWILDVSDMSVRNIGDTVIPTVGACLVQQAENAFWLIGGEPDANKSRTNKITVIKL